MRSSKLKKLLAIVIATFIILPNITVMRNVNAADMDPEYATPKHGIPVMYLNIDESKGTIDAMNNSPDHSANCYGTVDIKSPAGYKSEYTGAECQDLTGLELEYIRGRGNSTWEWFDKKPYKLKLKKGADLFGMGKNKHWVLLSNAGDETFLRNRISYWLADSIGMEYVSKSVPVELVINGKYNGLYYLCEQVRVGESRVNIDELSENDTSLPDISGGYLLTACSYYGGTKEGWFHTTRDSFFGFEDPDFSDYQSKAQKGYIQDYLQNTENALFGSGFKDQAGKSYKDYMDVKSAADYYLMEFFTVNQDAFLTPSAYMYKKRNGKLFWGPVWDFDVRTYVIPDEEGNVRDATAGTNTGVYCFSTWLERMKKDPEFKALLLERWKVMKAKIDEAVRDGGQLDKYYNEIKLAQTYDENKWHNNKSERPCNVQDLKVWMKTRGEYVSNNSDVIFREGGSYEITKVWKDGKWLGDVNYTATGSWNSDSRGYWFGDTSGWYAKSEWVMIDFTWYYFDENGYMVTNEWRDGRWLDSTGAYQYNHKGEWKSDSNGYWFCDDTGWYAKNQWQKIDGKWYYFLTDGYMDYSEYRDGCWLGSDGAWDEAYGAGHWSKNSRGWWYSDGDWYPVNQYLWIDGVQYWFDASGYMK